MNEPTEGKKGLKGSLFAGKLTRTRTHTLARAAALKQGRCGGQAGQGRAGAAA